MAKSKSLIAKQPIYKGNYMGTHNDKINFIDLDTGELLGLMGIPRELTYNPQSSWATIKPFGRNNPNYHITGSEDTLEMEITWWAMADDRLDVIARCKWLESMSKSDGYKNRPHYVRLMWGGLFAKAVWIVESAQYTLANFDATHQHVPTTAKQTVILKRITDDNRTTEEINDWRT
jgi:hypothetical protein